MTLPLHDAGADVFALLHRHMSMWHEHHPQQPPISSKITSTRHSMASLVGKESMLCIETSRIKHDLMPNF